MLIQRAPAAATVIVTDIYLRVCEGKRGAADASLEKVLEPRSLLARSYEQGAVVQRVKVLGRRLLVHQVAEIDYLYFE